tara:strand:- start:190 stop:726 length:537 start_codon:yes stop_codon:yes gene_type:complete
MPAFFLIFFTAAASCEVTVSRHAEEGHLDRWLSNCAVTCAICSSTGERATSATGAATYKGGMVMGRARQTAKRHQDRNRVIPSEHSSSSIVRRGNEGIGAVRRERGGGIGGRTAGNATAADASVAMTARFTSATRASPSLPAADTTRERVTRLDLCFVARVETSPEAFFAARADGFAE